jgi:peptidoglycan/LPS O-acetylase OafA/YrhL
MGNRPANSYRLDVDGLRAIAVIAVLAFHAFPLIFPAGFIGVDIFFVISGFLISGIILDGLKGGTFTFVDFYSRRVRRIFPALAVVCAACLAFGWVALLPDEFRSLGKHVVGGATFISNIILLRESGYFDVNAQLKPLLHLWSLGIEEQYYLVWPAVLFICRNRSRKTAMVIAVTGAISFAMNLYLTRTHPSAAYYLPFSRFFELMIGSALAFITRHIHTGPRFSNLKSFAGVAMLVTCFVLIDPQSYFPGWWAAWVCGGTYLLIDAGQTSWFNRRVLSSAPLVWLGRISYPLYLWHWPLLSFSFIVIGTPSVGFRLGILLLSVALAWLTNILLERPLQRRLIVTRLTPGALRLVAAMILVAMIGVLAKYALFEPVSARDPKDVAIGSAKADRVAVEEEVIPGTVGHTTLFFGDSHMQQ